MIDVVTDGGNEQHEKVKVLEELRKFDEPDQTVGHLSHHETVLEIVERHSFVLAVYLTPTNTGSRASNPVRIFSLMLQRL